MISASNLSDMALFPEMNPGPVCRLDTNGIILLANTKAQTFFGNKDLTGVSWLDLCPGMTPELWRRIFTEESLYAHEVLTGETWMKFSHVVPDTRTNVFVYGTDITVNKRNEEKLAEQAAEIREIARFPDMNPGPVLRMDPEGKIKLSNTAAAQVFGCDLSGRIWLEVMPGLTQTTWRQIVQTEEVIPVESRIGTKEFVFHHRHDAATNLVFAYGTDVTIQKSAERSLLQSEKMATLGTLAAGVAHELNNPAAATTRAAVQLREATSRLEEVHRVLIEPGVSNDFSIAMQELSLRIQRAALTPTILNSIQRMDRESEIEDWLEDNGFRDGSSLASLLVATGFTKVELETLSAKVSIESLRALLPWVEALISVHTLLHELSEGSSRISEIVGALRNYTFLGQAPIQPVVLHEGIENTLVIMRSKLKDGINVVRDYAPDMPKVMAYGSELNQVWTNLIDNAAYALGGSGEIRIRIRTERDDAVVEIEDNGPGIPQEIQSRVFDPFFTTKEPGKGTGLGLATTFGIITEKHKGRIELRSKPGSTVFTVRLPITSKV
jgi:signal transduction histidine kinase